MVTRKLSRKSFLALVRSISKLLVNYIHSQKIGILAAELRCKCKVFISLPFSLFQTSQGG